MIVEKCRQDPNGMHILKRDYEQHEVSCSKCGIIDKTETENLKFEINNDANRELLLNSSDSDPSLITKNGTQMEWISDSSKGLAAKLAKYGILQDGYTAGQVGSRNTWIEEGVESVHGPYKVHVDFTKDETFRQANIFLHRYCRMLHLPYRKKMELGNPLRSAFNSNTGAFLHVVVLKVILDNLYDSLTIHEKSIVIKELTTWREKLREDTKGKYIKEIQRQKSQVEGSI